MQTTSTFSFVHAPFTGYLLTLNTFNKIIIPPLFHTAPCSSFKQTSHTNKQTHTHTHTRTRTRTYRVDTWLQHHQRGCRSGTECRKKTGTPASDSRFPRSWRCRTQWTRSLDRRKPSSRVSPQCWSKQNWPLSIPSWWMMSTLLRTSTYTSRTGLGWWEGTALEFAVALDYMGKYRDKGTWLVS